MTDTKPGADELKVRDRLIALIDGPPALPPPPARPPMPAVPTKPTTRPRDWLDDILDEPAAEVAAVPEEQVKRPWWKAKPAPEPEDEPEDDEEGEGGEEGEDEEETAPPGWDPVAIADRIVHAYHKRPAGVRLKHAAQVITHSRARWGQLVYTATGVWAAWRIGFTPWLYHFTANAPLGIPIVALGVGWAVNRRLDGTPLVFAWVGRAIYTATVINLVLHP